MKRKNGGANTSDIEKTEKAAALYVRVSTDAQAEEGYSIEGQLERLHAQCVVKGYKKCEKYIDGGWSGSNLERPEMKRMIRDVHAGRIFCIMVYKLDRISRSQKDTLFLIEDVMLPNGVEFISLNENFDTSTSYGRAMIGILSAFAQLERENIRERTHMGMLERVKAGYWPGGGKTPFGYDYDRAKGILVPNADADKVRRMYQMYIDGASAGKIAQILGIKQDTLVRQILRRKSNTGIITYNGNEYPGRHQALISLETYETAMEIMRTRARKKSYRDSPYLLTGLAECGVCGAKMRYFRHKDLSAKDGYSLTLACNSRYKSKPYLVKDPSCDNEIANARELEARIVKELKEIGLRVEAVNDPREAAMDELLGVLKTRRNELEKRIKKLYLRYADEEDELLLSVIEDEKRELKLVEKRMDIESERNAELEKSHRAVELLPTISANWDHMTMAEKKELLRTLINKIVIRHSEVTIHYAFAEDDERE